MTLKNGGSVLIPCYPSGVVYDLFECLSTNLDNQGLSQIPMFFISPVADSSLAYSNILAEWLSSVKQNKVYIPDEPFPHASKFLRNSIMTTAIISSLLTFRPCKKRPIETFQTHLFGRI